MGRKLRGTTQIAPPERCRSYPFNAGVRRHSSQRNSGAAHLLPAQGSLSEAVAPTPFSARRPGGFFSVTAFNRNQYRAFLLICQRIFPIPLQIGHVTNLSYVLTYLPHFCYTEQVKRRAFYGEKAEATDGVYPAATDTIRYRSFI